MSELTVLQRRGSRPSPHITDDFAPESEEEVVPRLLRQLKKDSMIKSGYTDVVVTSEVVNRDIPLLIPRRVNGPKAQALDANNAKESIESNLKYSANFSAVDFRTAMDGMCNSLDSLDSHLGNFHGTEYARNFLRN